MKAAIGGSLLVLLLLGSAVVIAEDASLEAVAGISELTDRCALRAIRLEVRAADAPAVQTGPNVTAFDGIIELADNVRAVRIVRTQDTATLWVDRSGTDSLIEVAWNGTTPVSS